MLLWGSIGEVMLLWGSIGEVRGEEGSLPVLLAGDTLPILGVFTVVTIMVTMVTIMVTVVTM